MSGVVDWGASRTPNRMFKKLADSAVPRPPRGERHLMFQPLDVDDDDDDVYYYNCK